MSFKENSGRAASPIGPSRHFVSVTPSDTTDLAEGVTRGLYVGGAGAVAIDNDLGEPVVFISGDNQYHPIQTRRIRATGSTAIDIIALY